MKYLILIVLVAMTFGISASGSDGPSRHGGWTLESERDGIKIYTRDVVGSKIKQVRAVVFVKAPMETVLGVLTDYPNYDQWMNNVTESYVVDHPADSIHYVYRHEDAPWPVQNRYHVDKMVVEQTEQSASVAFRSMPNYIDKTDEAIEIQRYEGSWYIEETSRGVCQVELVLDENPGGYVPSWLVNHLAVDAPYKTMSNLRDKIATMLKS